MLLKFPTGVFPTKTAIKASCIDEAGVGRRRSVPQLQLIHKLRFIFSFHLSFQQRINLEDPRVLNSRDLDNKVIKDEDVLLII